MKKRVNKTVVIITALLTFGALGVTAKMHHHKHSQYAHGAQGNEHCVMWNACATDNAASAIE